MLYKFTDLPQHFIFIADIAMSSAERFGVNCPVIIMRRTADKFVHKITSCQIFINLRRGHRLRRRMKQVGCDIIQGYYFSRPVDAASFEPMLRDL